MKNIRGGVALYLEYKACLHILVHVTRPLVYSNFFRAEQATEQIKIPMISRVPVHTSVILQAILHKPKTKALSQCIPHTIRHFGEGVGMGRQSNC